MEKPLFEVTPQDANTYINYLKQQKKARQMEESTCYCIYTELRRFYESVFDNGCIDQNPFDGDRPFRNKDQLSASSLPSLAEVDHLLDLCSDNMQLYVAVLLAFRMVLPIAKIAPLRKNQFVYEKSSGDVYLSIQRQSEEEASYLYVPDDLHKPLSQLIASSPQSYPYLFRSLRNGPYNVRSLQHMLSEVQKADDTSIQFNQLRSLGIYFMMIEKIPADDICSYAGITDTWLNAFDHIPDAFRYDAMKYSRIYIREPGSMMPPQERISAPPTQSAKVYDQIGQELHVDDLVQFRVDKEVCEGMITEINRRSIRVACHNTEYRRSPSRVRKM
jgi:hypothetical protein